MYRSLHKELDVLAYKCQRCNKCLWKCPSYEVLGWETYSPRGRILLSLALLNNKIKFTEKLFKIYFTCFSCKMCEEICPAGTKTTDIFAMAKYLLTHPKELEEKIEEIELPKSILNILRNMQKYENPFGVSKTELTSWARNLNIPKNKERIFFASCMYYPMIYVEEFFLRTKGSTTLLEFLTKSKVIEFTKKLITIFKENIYITSLINAFNILKKLGVEFSYLYEDEPCCGAALHTYGFLSEFEEHAKKIYKFFKNRQIKEIITPNPICATIFKKYYPEHVPDFDIKVYTFIEYLAMLIKRNGIELKLSKPMKITIHDPCYSTRYLDDAENLRFILKNIKNLEIIEPTNTKKDTKCCGGGGVEMIYYDVALNLAKRRVIELLDTKAEAIVTSCPVCVLMLRLGLESLNRKDIKVYDVSDIIWKALATDSSSL
jgi:Fe-S oxidoreductase